MFGLRFPSDNATFNTGTLMIGTSTDTNLKLSKGNTFIGTSAGNINIAGHTGNNGCVSNTFLGTGAGFKTSSKLEEPKHYGSYNTYLGREAGVESTSGYCNSFVGSYAGKNNTTGSQNTFVGSDSGYMNDKGCNNTFIGYKTGYTSKGNDNILIGTDCVIDMNGSCNIAIGNNVMFSNNVQNSIVVGSNKECKRNNSMMLGNNHTDLLECNVNISIPSDSRYQTNIKEDVKGVDFIKRLRAVSFDTEAGRKQGVVGQELEIVIHDMKCEEIDSVKINDIYSVNYTALIPNLIKSVQELSSTIEVLKKEIYELKNREKVVTGDNILVPSTLPIPPTKKSKKNTI